jgi:hypothetical protein
LFEGDPLLQLRILNVSHTKTTAKAINKIYSRLKNRDYLEIVNYIDN